MEGRGPSLRSDLVISEVRDHSGTYYVVKDPVTRRFFRFKPPEHFIASQLDGLTPLEVVRRRVQSQFGMELTADKLAAFIRRLQNLGLLGDHLSQQEITRLQAEARDRPGYFSRFLFLKIKAVDPDRVLAAVIGRIGFMFTRGFVLLASFVILVGIVITVSNWGPYTAQVKDLFRPESIPTFILVVLVVTSLHELAHGFACKHFGGSVREIGFLLIYFMPAFYCNVSDAWLFGEKHQRLWVSFAGVFFQVFIWALATAVWRLIDLQTWLSAACAIAMATSGLTALFNFNPLIKLDGYYMLSDYLSVPNLRKRAFQYLIPRIKRALGWQVEAGQEVSARERRIFIWYGISAGVYSFGLLLFVFLKIAGFVVSRYHGAGLVALIVIVLLAFTGSFDRLAGRIRGMLAQEVGVARRKPRLILLAVVVAVLAILLLGKWELKISQDCRLLANSQATIRAEVEATVAEFYVDSGDTVKNGQVIAKLDDAQYRSELTETEAEIDRIQAELELLRKGPLPEEIEKQRKVVEKARMKSDFAEKELARISELHRRNLVSAAEHESAQENLSVLRKELEHAESELAVLLKGARPEEIKATEAELARLSAARDYLAREISKTEIQSPISGVVATPHLKERTQQYVDVGDEICTVLDFGKILVEIPVSEKDVADIEIGRLVRLKARSLPGRTYHGSVSSIAPAAISNDRHIVVVVTSEIENPDLLLKPGMTGNAKIHCGKRRILSLWMRRIVRFIRVEFWL